MKLLPIAAAILGALIVAAKLANRISHHEPVLPSLTSRINTQVHLINQD